uniref:Chondroitin proteoglycan 4 domain-containing protein n=1 Tax=Trichuris muris TaxID=70415 RepID=A0A5S6QAU9_TRIMR
MRNPIDCTSLLFLLVCSAGQQWARRSYRTHEKETIRTERATETSKCSEMAMAPFMSAYFSRVQLNYGKMFVSDLLFGREMYLPPEDKGNPLLELCKKYKEAMNDLAKCPPTNDAYYDKRRFVLYHFECVEHYKDIMDSRICTINDTMSAGKQCSQRCDHLRPVTAKHMQLLPGKEIEKIFDRVNMTTLYKENCRYVNCFIDCLTEAMKSGCTKKSAELYSQESRLAFKTLNDIYADLEMTEEDWPTQCRQLGTGTG